jgi:very-short-patch-repair endonuclease
VLDFRHTPAWFLASSRSNLAHMPGEREVFGPQSGFLHARGQGGVGDRRVAELAAESWGVLAGAELRACGLSPDQIATRRRRWTLHRLHRDTYAVGHPNPPWQGRMLAAAKACGPEAVVSHFAAAALWGFVEYDESRYPEVTVVGNGGNRHRGIKVHRTSALLPEDRARCQRVPVTAPARTLIDLAALIDGPPLRGAVRRAQGLKRVNLRQLNAALGRLAPRRGSRRLALIISSGPAPTETELEDMVLDLLLDGGFEHPDVNRTLSINGRRIRPDFRWPDQRLIVEADGAAWHDDPLARAADAERQALLEAAGERLIRVSWTQALTERPQTLARIRAAGAPMLRA